MYMYDIVGHGFFESLQKRECHLKRVWNKGQGMQPELWTIDHNSMRTPHHTPRGGALYSRPGLTDSKLASMDTLGAHLNWPRFACSLGLSILISLYGWKKRSLNLSGAMAAVVVGLVLTAASACFCVSLLTFFFTSSRLTKWRAKDKRKFEEDFKEGRR